MQSKRSGNGSLEVPIDWVGGGELPALHGPITASTAPTQRAIRGQFDVLSSHSLLFPCSSAPAVSREDKHIFPSAITIADVWHWQDESRASELFDKNNLSSPALFGWRETVCQIIMFVSLLNQHTCLSVCQLHSIPPFLSSSSSACLSRPLYSL